MKFYFLLSFFSFLVLVPAAFAQSDQLPATASAILSPAPVEYSLPYPGLLPDSPLYIVKVTRDRIVGFLIHEPLKKAEFNLLQSDKRINAAAYLLHKDKNKEELALSTAAKALNYYEEAIGKAAEAKTQQILVHEFGNTMLRASNKYVRILSEMEKEASTPHKKTYELLKRRINTLKEKVEEDLLQGSAASAELGTFVLSL